MKTVALILLLSTFIFQKLAHADIYFSKDAHFLERMVKIEDRGNGMIRFMEFENGEFKKIVGKRDYSVQEVLAYSKSRKNSVTTDWTRRVLVVGGGTTIGWFGGWLVAGAAEYARVNVGKPPLKFESIAIQVLAAATMGGMAWGLDHLIFAAPNKDELSSTLTCEAAIRPDIKFTVELAGYSVSTAMDELQNALEEIEDEYP